MRLFDQPAVPELNVSLIIGLIVMKLSSDIFPEEKSVITLFLQ